MRPFQAEFMVRRNHLKRYLALVCRTERQFLSSRAFVTHSFHAEMTLNVLRAGAFLVLYNLVEASARNAIEAIHDELNTKRVPFGILRASIRRHVIKGFKKHGNPDKEMNMADVPCELVSASLNVDDHFSGNVDAKLLKMIGAIYGFSTATDSLLTRDGYDLLIIKETRNDLAHGLKTYDDVGRQYLAKDLLGMSMRSTAFVSDILNSIARYLDDSRFLETEGKNRDAA